MSGEVREREAHAREALFQNAIPQLDAYLMSTDPSPAMRRCFPCAAIRHNRSTPPPRLTQIKKLWEKRMQTNLPSLLGFLFLLPLFNFSVPRTPHSLRRTRSRSSRPVRCRC